MLQRQDLIQIVQTKTGKALVMQLNNDPQIQQLANVWPLVKIDPTPDLVKIEALDGAPEWDDDTADWSIPDLIEQIWRHFRVDLLSIRGLLGMTFPAQEVFDRAKNLGIVYPNREIHFHAHRFLEAALEIIAPEFEPEPGSWDEVVQSVRLFQALMLEKLEANQHKGNRPGWMEDEVTVLIERANQELQELAEAYHDPKRTDVEIAAEAADVANFCMMISDKFGHPHVRHAQPVATAPLPPTQE